MNHELTDTLTWQEQKADNEIKCKERVKNLIAQLFDELNRMGNEEKVGEYVIEAIRYQHRTLQQNFFGHCVIPIIKDFAKRDENNYDLRNEASCMLAKKIEPVIRDVTRLPFI